jgi:long-chain acyl-CoA synthetase
MFPALVGLDEPTDVSALLAPNGEDQIALVAGLLAAGFRVQTPDLAREEPLQPRDFAADVLLTTPTVVMAVADDLSVRHELSRVVALGNLNTGLRRVLSDSLGRDVLVELGSDAAGFQQLVGPPGSNLAGIWSRLGQAAPDVPEDVIYPRSLLGMISALQITLPADCRCLVRVSEPAEVLGAELGCLAASCDVAVIDPELPPPVLKHLARAMDATCEIVSDGVPSANGRASLNIRDLRAQPATLPPRLARAGSTVAMSSGTQGFPKLVKRRTPTAVGLGLQGGMSRVGALALGLKGPGLHLVTLPLHHASARSIAVSALHAGEDLLFLGPWDAKRCIEILCEREVTSTFMVPAMFEGLLALPEQWRTAVPASLRSVIHGTTSCRVATKAAMIDWWGPLLYEYYSSVEMSGTIVGSDDWLRRPGTVGQPAPGVHVEIHDDEDREVPPGCVGRVHLTSPGFSYVGGTTAGGLIDTGDTGFLDAEGWLFLTGRRRDYISVGGYKFHPTSVEDAILATGLVSDCCVVGLPSAHLGEVPVALVTGDDALNLVELRDALQRELPRPQRPVQLRRVPTIPRDAQGKLRRQAALDLFRATELVVPRG